MTGDKLARSLISPKHGKNQVEHDCRPKQDASKNTYRTDPGEIERDCTVGQPPGEPRTRSTGDRHPDQDETDHARHWQCGGGRRLAEQLAFDFKVSGNSTSNEVELIPRWRSMQQ